MRRNLTREVGTEKAQFGLLAGEDGHEHGQDGCQEFVHGSEPGVGLAQTGVIGVDERGDEVAVGDAPELEVEGVDGEEEDEGEDEE